MHGHQLQIVLRRHYAAGRACLRKQAETGDRRIGPDQVNPHEPGKNHPNQDRQQSQPVILLTNHLVVETEDILADESLRSFVMCRLRRQILHVSPHGSGTLMPVRTKPVTARPPAAPAICRNLPGTSHSDKPSCCSVPGRKVGCTQFHSGRSLWL